MRNSARRRERNQSTKSRLRTLERTYLASLEKGDKAAAAANLRLVSSALDKAAKVGSLHKATANRKKSRLALRLAKAAQ